MCGPSGIGFLWGRAELLLAMEPFLMGGHMIRKVTADDVRRVAREYLVADRRTVGILVPTGPARTAAPPPSEMLH